MTNVLLRVPKQIEVNSKNPKKSTEIGSCLPLEFSNFGNRKRVPKRNGDGRAFPDIIHERGPETHDASSAFMPHARVHHTGRSSLKKLSGQTLGCFVAARVQTASKACVAANIMKRASKISEEIDVGKSLFLLPMDLLELPAFVVGHFQFRGLAGECSVPCAPFRPVEAASEGICMRKGCVDNMRVRKAKDQFPYRNTWKQASFPEKAVVCSPLQFE